MVAILLIDKKKYNKLGKIESTIGMSEQSASSQVLVNIYTKKFKEGNFTLIQYIHMVFFKYVKYAMHSFYSLHGSTEVFVIY